MQLLRYIAIALIFSFLGGVIMFLACEVQLLDRVELQIRLNQLEPKNPLKIDGEIGPLTIGKWDRVCAEQWGIRMHKRYMR